MIKYLLFYVPVITESDVMALLIHFDWPLSCKHEISGGMYTKDFTYFCCINSISPLYNTRETEIAVFYFQWWELKGQNLDF